jgi:hypothetical protein
LRFAFIYALILALTNHLLILTLANHRATNRFTLGLIPVEWLSFSPSQHCADSRFDMVISALFLLMGLF